MCVVFNFSISLCSFFHVYYHLFQKKDNGKNECKITLKWINNLFGDLKINIIMILYLLSI